MNNNQFIAACKKQGVNIKNITFKKKGVTISYNYDLPGNTLSSTYTHSYLYLDNELQIVYDNHFATTNQYVRF